jgi:predicted secreted protein
LLQDPASAGFCVYVSPVSHRCGPTRGGCLLYGSSQRLPTPFRSLPSPRYAVMNPISRLAVRLGLRPAPADPRSGRLVLAIECLANQNARDLGAANAPCCDRLLLQILMSAGVGMVQIPCPEIQCLGFSRERPPGSGIRSLLERPAGRACCRSLARRVADQAAVYRDQGFEVLAVLGGNSQSPACAVHPPEVMPRALEPESGLFMQELAAALTARGLEVPLWAVRDADARLHAQDLERLRTRLEGP